MTLVTLSIVFALMNGGAGFYLHKYLNPAEVVYVQQTLRAVEERAVTKIEHNRWYGRVQPAQPIQNATDYRRGQLTCACVLTCNIPNCRCRCGHRV